MRYFPKTGRSDPTLKSLALQFFFTPQNVKVGLWSHQVACTVIMSSDIRSPDEGSTCKAPSQPAPFRFRPHIYTGEARDSGQPTDCLESRRPSLQVKKRLATPQSVAPRHSHRCALCTKLAGPRGFIHEALQKNISVSVKRRVSHLLAF